METLSFFLTTVDIVKFFLWHYMEKEWKEVRFLKMAWLLVKGRSKARIEIET